MLGNNKKVAMVYWVEVKDRILDKSLRGRVQCLDTVEVERKGSSLYILH